MIHTCGSADISRGALIGEDSSVWHLAQIREGALIGRSCVVGRGAYIGPGVRVGDNVKIQNYALVYEPAVIEDGAFIGPAAVLTNDRHPRAVNPDGSPKSAFRLGAGGCHSPPWSIHRRPLGMRGARDDRSMGARRCGINSCT